MRCSRVLLPLDAASIQFRERARLKQALLYSRSPPGRPGDRRRPLRRGTPRRARRRLLADVRGARSSCSAARAMFPEHRAPDSRARRVAHAGSRRRRRPTRSRWPKASISTTRLRASRVATTVARRRRRLRGTSACGGRVTGRATVLADVTEARCSHAATCSSRARPIPAGARCFRSSPAS